MENFTEDKIKKLSTKRLLAIYRISREELREFSLCYEHGFDYENDDHYTINYDKMNGELIRIKKELDSRENISSETSKKERQRLAKKHKGGRRSHKKK